jgi:ABC-type sugar transport system ATPase subunit
VALTLETGGIWRRVRWSERRRRAARCSKEVGSTVDPARLAGSLSMPEQQLVEIAKAVGADAKVVIMDEPTASLMDDEVERLFAVIRQLRAQGCGIIYISHRLEEVFAMSDRITVLRDGETIATHAKETLDRPALIQAMVGRTLKETKPRQAVATGEWRSSSGICRIANWACLTCRSACGAERCWASRASSDPAGPSWRKRCSVWCRPMAEKCSSVECRSASARRWRRFSWGSATCRRIAAGTA